MMDFMVACPDEVQMTLTATLKLKEWKALSSKLNRVDKFESEEESCIARELILGIHDMVQQVENKFYPSPPKP